MDKESCQNLCAWTLFACLVLLSCITAVNALCLCLCLGLVYVTNNANRIFCHVEAKKLKLDSVSSFYEF